MSEFALYPKEQHWWSMNDYRCVMQTTQRVKPNTVLEFGPGSSTLSLIEGGAQLIHSCEDNAHWADIYYHRLQLRFPKRVSIVRYEFCDPLSIPTINNMRYDMALIDGPHGTERRGAVLEYCLDHCDSVLMCVENLKAGDGLLKVILASAERRSLNVEIMETGPLSGSFAFFPKTLP